MPKRQLTLAQISSRGGRTARLGAMNKRGSAAGRIQRQWRRRSRSKRQVGFVNRQNVEVKSLQHTAFEANLSFFAGSDTLGPANSQVNLIGMFGRGQSGTPHAGMQRGTGCDQLIGCWIKEAYPASVKWVAEYDRLTPLPTGVFPSTNFEVVYGIVKNTPEKMGIAHGNATTEAAWHAAVLLNVKKELYESGYDADHLAYTQKNRRVKILKRHKIRPQKSQAFVHTTFTGDDRDPIRIFAPKSEGSFKFPISGMKTRLVNTGDPDATPSTEYWQAGSMWIPFVMFLAPGLSSADAGSIRITYVSKAYVTDV